jgi:hypothetical protein
MSFETEIKKISYFTATNVSPFRIQVVLIKRRPAFRVSSSERCTMSGVGKCMRYLDKASWSVRKPVHWVYGAPSEDKQDN